MWLKFFVGFGLSLCCYYFIHIQKHRKYIEEAANKLSQLRPPNVEIAQPPSSSLLHMYAKAAVCSDKTTCSSIGRAILQHNGNAIDAAIATLLCNGLITMQSMGIGGGVIITYYSKKFNQAKIVIGRERAPYNIKLEHINIQNETIFSNSALAIAVPGELAAYYEAHRRFGLLDWSHLIEPSLKLCYQGYKLTRHQRDALHLNEEMIRKNVLLSQMFIDTTTNLFYMEGWHIKFPSVVCKTYKLLAEEGPLTFYNGSLSKLIAKDLEEIGSPITLQDLYNYKAELRDSIVVNLEPYNIYLPPPPGSGHVVGFIMKLLHHLRKEFSLVNDLSSLDIHRIVEALKFGFVKRWQYDVDVDLNTIESLFKTESIKNISHLFDDLRTFDDIEHYGPQVKLIPAPDHGTAHISVLAPNGDAVSATSSINYYFGSGRMGLRSGILFNNAMADFTIPNIQNYFNLPNVESINQFKALKCPMSSMAPLIVTNNATGEVRLVLGAAGGSRIISTLTQILVRVLWKKQNIKEAIDSPRFHHQLLPKILEYEFGILQQIVNDLEYRGHKTERVRRRSTAVCGIEKHNSDVVLANADYRKEGGVDGF